MTKGGGWEWGVARRFSTYLTGDDHHLIRANTSGGWATSRRKSGKTVGSSHVGDIAPAGTEVPDIVKQFSEAFLVECKAYKDQPNWWSVFSGSAVPKFVRWWIKATEQADADKRRALLVIKRNNRPPLVGHDLPESLVPGPSMTVTYGGETVTFHRLDDLLSVEPLVLLGATQ